MKKRDIYNYDNPQFALIRQPMRDVMQAYGEAERFFANIKEITWANFGMKSLTGYIHALEHIQPDAVDRFKGILATNGLIVEYPSIGELIEDFPDLDKVFEVCVGILDEIDDKLHGFIETVDEKTRGLSAMARAAENLQMENAQEKTFLLEAWAMYDNGASASSFDNWVKNNAPYMKE